MGCAAELYSRPFALGNAVTSLDESQIRSKVARISVEESIQSGYSSLELGNIARWHIPMNKQRFDYEPFRRLALPNRKTELTRLQRSEEFGGKPGNPTRNDSGPGSSVHLLKENSTLRRGHLFSYLGLFLFTTVVYFRPYELIPSVLADLPGA